MSLRSSLHKNYYYMSNSFLPRKIYLNESHRNMKAWERRWGKVQWQEEQVEWGGSVWGRVQPTESTKEKPKVKSEDNRCLPQTRLLFCWHQIPPLPWSHQRILSQIWQCEGIYASLDGIIGSCAGHLMCSCSVTYCPCKFGCFTSFGSWDIWIFTTSGTCHAQIC